MDGVATGKDMCGQGTCQYDDKRHVKQEYGYAPVKLLLQYIGTRGYREHGPQCRKPPGTIDVVADVLGAVKFLYDRGRPYTHHNEYV